MATPEQIRANQINAQQSTGPRTRMGKWIASHNSVRHGVFARHLLLPGEDSAELSQLKAETLRRLNPRDGLELRLVEQIVTALWKLQRVQRAEQALHTNALLKFEFYRDESIHEKCGIGRGAAVPIEQVWLQMSDKQQAEMERLEKYEHRLQNTVTRGLRQLEKLQKQMPNEKVSALTQATLAAEANASQKVESEAKDADLPTPEAAPQAGDEKEDASPIAPIENVRSRPIPTVAELMAIADEAMQAHRATAESPPPSRRSAA